jgi:chromate transporter
MNRSGEIAAVTGFAVHDPRDFGLALVAFVLLTVWRAPPWIVVVLAALGGGTLELAS